MGCSPSACSSSVLGIFLAGVLECVVISSLGDHPDPGIELESPVASALTGGFFSPEPLQFSSVQFSCSVVSDSLRPHESQHARPPCPSPTPIDYSNIQVHKYLIQLNIKKKLTQLKQTDSSPEETLFQKETYTWLAGT